jgi:hypothetical protein
LLIAAVYIPALGEISSYILAFDGKTKGGLGRALLCMMDSNEALHFALP